MYGLKPSTASVQSQLKNEAEKAIEGWDENVARMPTRIVITIGKKNPELPPNLGNVSATVKLS
jgi:hypothetical protein